MTATRIEDLGEVEVEHLLGLVTKAPLVLLRCKSEGTVLVAQLPPGHAREIAAHLLEAAARSEYEHDLWAEMERAEWTESMIGSLLSMIRAGEARRLGGPS